MANGISHFYQKNSAFSNFPAFPTAITALGKTDHNFRKKFFTASFLKKIVFFAFPPLAFYGFRHILKEK